jgi:uncharacterized membrane protein
MAFLWIFLALCVCLALVALILWWDLRKYPTTPNDIGD